MVHYHQWVLATLFLAALPCLVQLPIWVGAIVLSGSVLHYSGDWRLGRYGKIAGLFLLACTVCGIWLSFDSWISGESVLTFFIAVVFLKWGEGHSRRDYLLLIFAAVVLAAVGALYWESLFSLLHMFVVIFALTASLIAIHGGEAVPVFSFVPKRAAVLVLLGLPLMGLLFLSFPRIPGPLWDIGLAFGLPVKALMDRGDAEFGKMKVLQKGGIQRTDKENTNVLVAEFKGAVPFKSRLYWRGPVFWDFDGENWSLPEGWDNRSRLLSKAIRSKNKLTRELRSKGRPVQYSLRVMPNGGRWLYALDVPAAPAPESFISDEFQLLSIRKIDDYEPKLDMLSYLDYAIGSEITGEQREMGLSWPEGTNPRLQSLGKELAAKYQSPEEIIHQGLKILATGKYRFDSNAIITPGPDMLDRFFFDEKLGGSQVLAGSFVMLMRAAGIPARLISGFRGGTIVALTNFVIVKRADAHTWVELWQDDIGWTKVEPKDAVLPPLKKEKIKQVEPEKQDMEVMIKPAEKESVDSLQPTDGKQKNTVDKNKGAKGLSLPDWADLFGSLQKWVINYNPDRQVELLKGLGAEESNWLDLLLSAVAGFFAVLALYLVVAWWRGREKIDLVGKSWNDFCVRMNKLGIRKHKTECPGDFIKRLSTQRPELAAAAEDITNRYIDIRYGAESSSEAVSLLQRQVKRFVSMT